MSLSAAKILAFYEIQDGRYPAFWSCWGSYGPTREVAFLMHSPCKNFVRIGSVVFKL